MNPYAAQIYIDGSCMRNPDGPGGLAGLLEMPDKEPVVIFQEGYKHTTNNRMEIRALIKALEHIRVNSSELRKNGVEIWTDSELTKTCFYSVERWRAGGWTGTDGKPIKNVNLLKRILTLKSSIGCSCKAGHITGKSTEITKRVDRLAKEAAKGSWLIVDDGYIRPKVCKTGSRGPTGPFDAKEQVVIIRIFEHTLIGHRKDSLYKVKFEVCSASGKEKYYAYCSDEVNRLLHRWHYYKARFNRSQENPRIVSVEEVGENEFRAQC